MIAIATGEVHTLALKSDGSVVAWGLNDFGQTSVPAGLTGVTAISVGATHSVALKSDDNVVAWGNNGHGETDVPVGLSNVTAIAAGYFHTVAMTADLSVSYGNQAVAQASGPRTLEIRNSGTSTLTVSSVSVTGGNAADFTVNTSGMLTRVPVQGSTTFTVSFTPSAVGVRATTLRILSDDPDEGTLDVALTGTGFNTPPTITANSLTRSVGTTNANLAIAQVSDAEQAANSLAAQVNNAASATVNGVTVSELTIDAAGLVTAKVAVNCNAANTAFTLKVTDLAGAAATATLNVAVTAVGTATITTQPVKRTVNANESATFSVTATGSDLAYQWRKNGVAMANGWSVQGATTATLTLNPALASDAGSYDVIVSNGCQSLTSAPAALTLNGATAPLLVNEFRFSGPQGAGDWYVELFNNTDAPIRTNGLVIAFADAAGLLSETFPLTLERTIPAKGCYLIAGPQYSLSLAAAADQVLPNFTTLTSLGGVALFADTPQSARRLDSVAAQGFVQSSILQYFVEGTATANVGNPLTEYAWVRKATSLGLPSDTNNNAADFILVAPTATPLNGTTPQPGAPGPQSSASPLVNNAGLPVALLNPANSATSGPNTFVENVAVTVGVATYPRSLYLRRTLTNNTNKPVTKLRFRITEISNGGVNTAILRALSSDDITINGLAVKGLTLETPPLQPTGGGLNSTLSAGAITLAAPLTAGAKVNVQFRLGVVQGGSYRFYANIEAAN